MLSNLVYVSYRKPECTEGEIQNILDACQRNNKELDITGVLLYSDKQFVQYLEGEYKTIYGLYDKIKTDNRHKNVVLISSYPIKERVFPSWQMGAKQFKEDNVDFLTDLSATEKQKFRSILAGEGQEDNKAMEVLQKIFK